MRITNVQVLLETHQEGIAVLGLRSRKAPMNGKKVVVRYILVNKDILSLRIQNLPHSNTTGTCTEVSESGNFCGKWHCEQDEYDKCGQGEGCNDCDPDGELKCLTLCAQQNSDTQTHTNNTGCQYCYNCYGYDSDGYYYSYNIYPQKEFQDCLCMSDCTFLKKKRQHS